MMKTNEELVLVKPTKKDAGAIMEFRQEFLAARETAMPGANDLIKFDNFEDWWKFIKAYEKRQTVPVKGHVPSFEYLLKRKSDGKLLGMLQIRTALTDGLLKFGGHFGGCVRPSERSKGYSTEMIGLGIKKAKKMGIDKVLITCKKENVSSAKSIQKAGGVFENEVDFEGTKIQRYWI